MPFTTTIAKCKEEERKKGWVAAGADAAHINEKVRKGCVAAVKALTGAPETAKWRRGKKVKGNNIPPGTAIATFPVEKDDEPFGFKGHAAIYSFQTEGCLHVYDQHENKRFSWQMIRFQCGGYVSNDGEAFYVIETMQDSSTTDPALCGPTSFY